MFRNNLGARAEAERAMLHPHFFRQKKRGYPPLRRYPAGSEMYFGNSMGHRLESIVEDNWVGWCLRTSTLLSPHSFTGYRSECTCSSHHPVIWSKVNLRHLLEICIFSVPDSFCFVFSQWRCLFTLLSLHDSSSSIQVGGELFFVSSISKKNIRQDALPWR